MIVIEELEWCVIEKITLTAERRDNRIELYFDNANVLTISDEGQLCCETRYITCDDNLSEFVGAKFIGYEVANGVSYEDAVCGLCHDEQFLRIHTDRGILVCANHNEHNGYYSGFSVVHTVSKYERN